jgi:ferredoxin-NADP reductase
VACYASPDAIPALEDAPGTSIDQPVPDALTLAVHDVAVHTPTSRILTLALDDIPFHYRAGQSVILGRHGQPDRRPYSIAGAPTDAARTCVLEFLLRADHHGLLGRHLDGVAAGTRIDVEGPFGDFTLPEVLPDAPLLFVAGGTGIAPLRAMARDVAQRGHRAPMDVLYSVRSADDVAYADEWVRWVAEGRGRLALTVTRGAETAVTRGGDGTPGTFTGRIDRARLAPFVRHVPDVQCFVCGPPGFVDDIEHALSQLGVAADRIRREGW